MPPVAVIGVPRVAGGVRVVDPDEPVIVTGVPRPGRDDDDIPTSGPSYPTVPYTSKPRASVPSKPSPKPPVASEPPEWRWVCTQIEAPSERNPGGAVVEGYYAIKGGVLYVEDQSGPVASQWLQPDDNPAAVARRLLREKRSPNNFYAPIIYPHRVLH
jgi:hypothetical protein